MRGIWHKGINVSIAVILSDLTRYKLITPVEETSLKTISDAQEFLTSVIGIYQKKVKIYLKAPHSQVQQTLPNQEGSTMELDARTIEKIIHCTYSAFIEYDKFSVIGSLKLLLESEAPDLLISLGLGIISQSGQQVLETVKKVFVEYVARYRLWNAVNQEALTQLCETVEPRAPLLFPIYLISAFKIENMISNQAKTHLKNGGNLPLFFAGYIQANSGVVRDCLRGTIFYLGTIVDTVTLVQSVRDQHFAHLKNRQTQIDFADAIADGYLDKMQTHSQQLDIDAAKSRMLTLAATRICIPALRLIDLPVTLNLEQLQKDIDALKKDLTQHALDVQAAEKLREKNQETLNQNFKTAQQQSYQRIDEWRAGIPKRPITFGVTVGMHIPTL